MEENKRKFVIPVKPIFMGLVLVCSILSLLAYFGYGFDVDRKFIDFPMWVCPLPLIAPFIAFLIEEMVAKPEKRLFFHPSQKYPFVLKVSLIAEGLFFAIGLTMLILNLTGVFVSEKATFPLQMEAIMFLPGTIVFFILNLVYAFLEKAPKKAIAAIAIALLMSLLSFTLGYFLSTRISYEWSLLYIAGTISLLIATYYEIDSPTEPLEHQQ